MAAGHTIVHWTWFGSGTERANADHRAPAHCVLLPDGIGSGQTSIPGMTTLCGKTVPTGTGGNAFWRQRECALCKKALAKIIAGKPNPWDAIFGKAEH